MTGTPIDWGRIDPYVFAHARTIAIAADERGIDALIRPALRAADEVEAHERLRDKMRQAEREFFAPGPRRTRAQLDDELRRALDERARHLDPGGDPFGPRRGGTGRDAPGPEGLGR